MRLTKFILTAACSVLLLTGCKDAASEPKLDATETAAITEKAPIPVERLETASFSIEGMTCSIGCAKTIEKKLAGMDGVQKATVDFDKKTATIEFDKSKQTSESLVKSVEETADGKTYKVSDVHSSGDHAMLMDHEKEKEKKKRKGNKSSGNAKEEKSGCCSGKKHCTEENKA